jgi:hypothetical protein
LVRRKSRANVGPRREPGHREVRASRELLEAHE